MELPASAATDLLFAGDVFCDLFFAGVDAPKVGAEVYAEAFGFGPGGVANRAVAAARVGARTRLLSRLGDDPLGSHLRTVLEAEPALDVSLLGRSPGYQSPVTVALTGPQDRSFITYAEPHPPLVLPADLGPVRATHVGIGRTLPDWVAPLRATGTTIVAGVGWDETGAWAGTVLDRLAEVDVFVPNAVEAMRYTRTDDPVTAARALAERVPLVVVTRAGEGVIAVDAAAGQLVTVPAVPVDVRDPTGAGDVFVATFMAARLRADWDLERQLRFGTLCASVSVTGLGGAGSAPRLADLAPFARLHDPAGDWAFLDELPA